MQQGGGGQQNDQSMGPIWLAILIIAAFAFIWWQFSAQIVTFVLQIKIVEAEMLSVFVPSLKQQIAWIHQVNPASVTFQHLVNICDTIGRSLMYPLAALIIALAGILYFRASPSRYCETYTMDSLREKEKINWPQISPVVNLDLVNTDIDIGPWAMSIQPMTFAKRYNLLREEETKEDEDKVVIGNEPIKVKLLKGEAMRVFTLQLGPYWKGPDHLPMHVRALFAAFAARINHDVAAASELLLNIARSINAGQLDFKGTDELLRRYQDSPAVKQICDKHAYVMTVMASMLEVSRLDGVMASSDFLWLKPVDRRLWYMLNNVGRATAFPEVAGPTAHWLAEKTLYRALHVPNVQAAVKALDDAVAEVIYQPDDESAGSSASAA